MVAARTAVAWMGMISGVWRHSIEKKADAINDMTTLIRLQLAKATPDQGKVDENLPQFSGLSLRLKKGLLMLLSRMKKREVRFRLTVFLESDCNNYGVMSRTTKFI